MSDVKKGIKNLLWLLVAATVVIIAKPYWQSYWWRARLFQEPAPVAQSLPNPIPARGTPVRSTTKGVVTRIGENNLGGNVVGVTGPGGVWHYYAHLDSFADIRENDWIEAGTVVGYVGNTGNARNTPPHLHYGVYIREGAVNPYPLIIQP